MNTAAGYLPDLQTCGSHNSFTCITGRIDVAFLEDRLAEFSQEWWISATRRPLTHC